MKRRITAILICSALALTMLAGCGKKDKEPAAEPVKEETAQETEKTEPVSEVKEQVVTGDEEEYYGSYWRVLYNADLFNLNPEDGNMSTTLTYAKECAGSCYVQITETGYENAREASNAFFTTTEKTEEYSVNIGGVDAIQIKIIEDETTQSASGLKIENSFTFVKVEQGVLAIEVYETIDPDEAGATVVSDAIAAVVDSIEFAEPTPDFIPSNAMEDRVKKTEFDSEDEIIGNLIEGEAYGYAKVMGSKDELLFITSGTFEDGGKNYAMEAYPYIIDDNSGKYYCVGMLFTDSTSTPIAVSDDGLIYVASHYSIEKDCLDADLHSLMIMEYHYITYDDDGSAKGYGGFVRDKNSVNADTKDYDGDDPFYFDKSFEEYESCKPIEFTIVK